MLNVSRRDWLAVAAGFIAGAGMALAGVWLRNRIVYGPPAKIMTIQ